MLWTHEKVYTEEPFELEADLEKAINEVEEPLFGSSRIYIEVKKRIGVLGGVQNIPDAYLIDLTSKKKPVLYVVENELAKHHPLKHIAVQILQFSLSFESTPQTVKSILKEALTKNQAAYKKCQKYALEHGFENVDYLLEKQILTVSEREMIEESQRHIPSWVKTSTGWWHEEKISDDEFTNLLENLIKRKIIVI